MSMAIPILMPIVGIGGFLALLVWALINADWDGNMERRQTEAAREGARQASERAEKERSRRAALQGCMRHPGDRIDGAGWAGKHVSVNR